MSNSKSMRILPGIAWCLCIVLLMSSGGTLLAQNQEHRVRNIVSVHGAWADGSGWRDVHDKLFPSDLAKSGAIKKTPDGFTYIGPARFHELFAADLPNDWAAFMARSQVLNLAEDFAATITTAAWRNKPSWMSK